MGRPSRRVLSLGLGAVLGLVTTGLLLVGWATSGQGVEACPRCGARREVVRLGGLPLRLRPLREERPTAVEAAQACPGHRWSKLGCWRVLGGFATYAGAPSPQVPGEEPRGQVGPGRR